jgi:hypothetical protein
MHSNRIKSLSPKSIATLIGAILFLPIIASVVVVGLWRDGNLLGDANEQSVNSAAKNNAKPFVDGFESDDKLGGATKDQPQANSGKSSKRTHSDEDENGRQVADNSQRSASVAGSSSVSTHADYAEAVANLLTEKHNMADPVVRADVVRRVKEAETARINSVLEKARKLSISTEGDRPGGGRYALIDFEGDDPVYEKTENVNAAISTTTNLVRSTAPYAVSGTGMSVGLWEAGGIPRITHQEFGSPTRVSILDGSSSVSSHATHVAGTLIAVGVNASVRGMAPDAKIRGYSSTSDSAEMLAEGAAIAGDPGKIYVSNHSYGSDRGWEDDGGDFVYYGTFSDDGNPTNDSDQRFGRYDSSSSSWDGLTYNLPYYLPFISAGNHRNDGPPSAGALWYQGSISGTQRAYNAAQHPAGDGDYKGGFDTCEGKKLSKNVITVGSILDAVSGTVRSLSNATLSSFSSTGPADDGRIKPDIVANGNSLTSSINTSNTSIGSSSGTSMASPNAAGSALLLQQYYSNRFPGSAMRGDTLKALIIHTADDLGNPGPDYRFGWGLMNTSAAANLLKKHADASGDAAVIVNQLSSTVQSRTHTFASAGTAPLRFTLCWTDPAGSAKVLHDDRGRSLVNDLNLAVTGPSSSTHRPYVMPHVGNWSLSSLSANATTGVNTVDNVEQVYLSTPPGSELYTVTVSYAGVLAYGLQNYSLIVSGQANLAEIVVEQPTTSVIADGGSRSFGNVGIGQSSQLVFLVKNIGTADLTGLALSKSGPDAAMFEFIRQPALSVSGPSGTTTFGIRFTPTSIGAKSATFRLANNDINENPYDISLMGNGIPAIEGWRMNHFGVTTSTGNAADHSDPDKDGLVNLIEFAFGLDPLKGSPHLMPKGQLQGGDFVVSFPTPPGVSGVTYAAEWSTTLAEGQWLPLADSGSGNQHTFRVPVGSGTRKFLRMKVSTP